MSRPSDLRRGSLRLDRVPGVRSRPRAIRPRSGKGHRGGEPLRGLSPVCCAVQRWVDGPARPTHVPGWEGSPGANGTAG